MQYLIVVIFFVTVTIAACGTGTASEDVAPVEIEAQAAPTATPIQAPVPTLTDLPTEIVEPESPIVPVSPVEKPVMAQESEVEPIPGSQDALAAAMADLAERTGLEENEIVLVSIEAVDWNDASLGCPQEGFMYAQVITPGFLIVLKAQDQEYEYHTDQRANVVLCEQ